MTDSPIPAKVRCYGCGAAYNPLDDAEHHQHTHHTGAAFGWALRPRRRGPLGWLGARQKPASPFVHSVLGTAAGWLDKCQVERDVAIRAAASLELELVDDATGRTYTHGLTIPQADALLHELRTRILQARNSPPPDSRRLPYVE